MQGRTHALSGLVAGAAVAEFGLHADLAHTAALAGYTAGMALICDLDSCGGSSARCFGLISGAVSRVVRRISGGHRHFTHSVGGIAVFTGLAWLACRYRHDLGGKIGLALLLTIAVSSGLEALSRRMRSGHLGDLIAVGAAAGAIWQGYGLALIPLATLLGCLVHCIADSCTDSGVMWLYPVSKYRWHFLPEPLAWSTGSRPERWIVTPLLVAAVAALAAWAADPALVHGLISAI